MATTSLPANVARDTGPERRSAAWVVRRALAEPGWVAKTVVGLTRGAWYRAYYRLRGVRLRTGRHFRVLGRLDIKGPGEVTFGDHVLIVDPARLWTYERDARIVVGDNVMMGAADIQCRREVLIGSDCILARCTILDSDFHPTRADRYNPAAPIRVAPVHVGDNVWIAHSAGLLPGTKIGNNSVVSFGSVCMREYPANVIIMGNPAKVAAPIPAGGSSPGSE
jgi:acetyltransferase-like isoleucine patch superfamily enzyme